MGGRGSAWVSTSLQINMNPERVSTGDSSNKKVGRLGTRLVCSLESRLGPPVMPFYLFFGEGSPTKIDCRKKDTHIPTSLLEDLGRGSMQCVPFTVSFRGSSTGSSSPPRLPAPTPAASPSSCPRTPSWPCSPTEGTRGSIRKSGWNPPPQPGTDDPPACQGPCVLKEGHLHNYTPPPKKKNGNPQHAQLQPVAPIIFAYTYIYIYIYIYLGRAPLLSSTNPRRMPLFFSCPVEMHWAPLRSRLV